MEKIILKLIAKKYLSNQEFNGFPLRALEEELEINKEALMIQLILLIKSGQISIVYTDVRENSHIRAVEDESIERQISKLDTESYNNACAYPLFQCLNKIVTQNLYDGKPFTLEIALGQPQLAFRFFDTSILENYQNEPRYYYTSDDIEGKISIKDRYFQDKDFPDRDQILLKTFGFAYNENLEKRVLTSLLRYLSRLTPEHQALWKAKELKGPFQPHPEYEKRINGEYSEYIIVFDAILQEIAMINNACKKIGWKHLFKENYIGRKPPEFSFLLRSTSKEYNEFIHMLDKIFADNLNKEFFKDKINLVEEVPHKKDGKIQVIPKGTIRLLKEWLVEQVALTDERNRVIFSEAIETFEFIKRERNQLAGHTIRENIYDVKYFAQQREIIQKGYKALKTLRLLFLLYPECRQIKLNYFLEKGKILSF